MSTGLMMPTKKKKPVLKPRPEWDGDGLLKSKTALPSSIQPKLPPPAKGDRRTIQERLDAAEREEARRVALSQPTRGGSEDKKLATPLGRFCAAPHGPSDTPPGHFCHIAGERYAEIVRQEKTAQGFDVIAWAPSDGGFVELTPEQVEAQKQLAISRLKEANEILRAVDVKLPQRMELLCYDQREPSIYHEESIFAGLLALVRAWKLTPKKYGDKSLDS